MNRVLVDTSVHQTRIAVVEEGRLAELYYDSKREESIVGNIYAGRVETVLPGMQSSFIEIGQKKNAYLYYGQERAVTDTDSKNSKKPKSGDTILVQVEKDAIGAKGAVVTEKLSFPGKFLVLLRGEAGEIGISKKITDVAERRRIKETVEQLIPQGYGVIVRTNGAGKTTEDYEREIGVLVDIGETVYKKGQYAKSPSLIYQEASSAIKAARDLISDDIQEFVVNDRDIYEELLGTGNFDQAEGCKLILSEEENMLFENYFVESQAEKALNERVWLKSGGFLVIEQTEACVVIDVNTGKYTGKRDLQKTIRKTNMEAALEIAHQLRLRNLSGMIIVDFIDMVSEEDRKRLTHTLEQAVTQDRIKTVVVGMTELGLMQITRKKTRSSLHQQMTTNCRCCEGTGRLPSIEWVVGQMRREIVRIFINTIYCEVRIKADSRLLAAFCGEKETFLKELEIKYDKRIICEAVDHTAFGYYDIEKYDG